MDSAAGIRIPRKFSCGICRSLPHFLAYAQACGILLETEPRGSLSLRHFDISGRRGFIVKRILFQEIPLKEGIYDARYISKLRLPAYEPVFVYFSAAGPPKFSHFYLYIPCAVQPLYVVRGRILSLP